MCTVTTPRGVEMCLAADETAPAQARATVRERFGPAIGPAALETALLVTSELVSNAVIHSGATPRDKLKLRVRREPGVLGIEVAHNGTRFGLSGLRSDPHGGRGLRLVAALSARWGLTSDESTTTWAEVATG